MGERIAVGDKLPFFLYDTPYSAENRFRDLLEAKSPLVLVFMANFGHPITRTFASRYAETFPQLRDGGFALVVRSRADKLAAGIGPDTLPYPLLCDAEGVLYEHLAIPQSTSTLMTYSLEGWRILRDARKQGYTPVKGQAQQLPLTLILDRDGTVLFCHYGASLTDVPEDCGAMQSLLEELELVPELPDLQPLPDLDAMPDFETGEFTVPNEPAAEMPDTYVDDVSEPTEELPRPKRNHHGRHRRARTGAHQPAESVHEYGTPDLQQTSVIGLFDDTYPDE